MIELRKEKPLVHEKNHAGGFLIIDKPAGPSSHEVTAWVRKMTGLKAGHSGTLDPFATGVLVVGLGKGVKLLQALNKSDKEYIGLAAFEGVPEETELKRLFTEFTGEIYQTPPMESAVRKVLRKRTIYSLELLEIKKKLVLFRVQCQHGTYVRNLVSDIGELLGTNGKLVELRRTRAGTFSEKEAITIQDLKDAKDFWEMMLPMEALPVKKVVVGNKAVSAVCYGAKLARAGVIALDEDIEEGDIISLTTGANEIIGIATAKMTSDEIVEAKKGIVAESLRIVMERDLYPKWK